MGVCVDFANFKLFQSRDNNDDKRQKRTTVYDTYLFTV